MSKLGKRLISLSFILIFAITALAAQQTAVDRAVTLINKNLILNDYDKAYSYAKFIIGYYADDTIPDDILTSINEAISERGKYLADSEQWSLITDMEQDLQSAPASVQNALKPSLKRATDHFKQLEEEKERERIAQEKAEQERQRQLEEEKRQKEIQEQEEKRKKEIQEQEEKRQKEIQAMEEKRLIEELKQKEKEAATKAEKDAEFQKILDLFEKQMQMQKENQEETVKQQMELEKQRQDIEKQRQENEILQQQNMSEIMVQINENNTNAMKKVSSNNKVMFIGFGILILIFIGIIVFVIILIIHQAKVNQEQMKNTILTMQAMRVAPPAIDMLPLTLQMENLKLADSSMNNSQQPLALENDSNNPEEPVVQQEEIKALITTCKKYGEQIDMVTGRKNVTSRVAELVFKISQKMGYSDIDCILHYAAALVYDIGFLSIDSSILLAESLTQAQYELIKTHTEIGPNMVFFVEEKYRELFRDATGKHHENLDGSGYPAGLKNQQIPYIARVLHVVESFIAMTSSRNYKTIGNRDSAIQDLKNTPKQYDQDIVSALDEIV